MNMLENLDTLGLANFKKLIDLIIPKKERRQSRIIIDYIRIYTQLNNAFNLLNREYSRRAMEYISVARNIIRENKFEEEKPYLNRILNILNSILRNREAVISKIKKEQASDPFHIKTSVLLAQNICILRILKINKY